VRPQPHLDPRVGEGGRVGPLRFHVGQRHAGPAPGEQVRGGDAAAGGTDDENALAGNLEVCHAIQVT
jgi:hypothetical protein